MSTAPTTDTPPDPTHALLDVAAIEIAPDFNARSSMDEQQMSELVASVTESGVIQPIIVVRRKPTTDAPKVAFTLVAGHRRVEASKLAERSVVPAVVYDQLDAASRMQLALVENLQREDINPIDEARGYQRAISDAKLTQAKLATLTGKPQSRICERLKLLKLPDKEARLQEAGP